MVDVVVVEQLRKAYGDVVAVDAVPAHAVLILLAVVAVASLVGWRMFRWT